MIRRWLVSRPWPQPWLIEALLYVLLYEMPGTRFTWSEVWRAKEGMSDDLPTLPR